MSQIELVAITRIAGTIGLLILVTLVGVIFQVIQSSRRNHLLRSIDQSLKLAPWTQRASDQGVNKIRAAR